MKRFYWQKISRAALIAVMGIGLVGTTSAQPEQSPPPPPAEGVVHDATTNALGEAEVDTSEAPVAVEKSGRQRSREAVVSFGTAAELKADESAEAVVAILGSAIARGDVKDAVVAVAGNVIVSGEVGDAAVAVFGDLTIEQGAKVNGDVVSVGGNVTIADGAVVRGEVVCVGGKVDIAEGAEVARGVQEVPVPGLHMLKNWVIHCLFKLRPLAPQVGWVWVVAGIVFLVYLLVAVATPKPVEACVRELTRRPATTFLMGLLTILLLPVVVLILAATGIGVFVIPFLMAALLFGALVGKVAFLEFVGESVVRAFSSVAQLKPAVALLLGCVILTVFYLVPILGLITFMVSGLWALGGAVMGLFGRARRELPERPPATPSPTMPAPTQPTGAAGTAAFAATSTAPVTSAQAATPAAATTEGAPSPTPMAVPTGAPAAAPEAFSFPRASFWERMGAAFLDVILVAILSSVVGGATLGFLVALAYFAGMWAWKGTTVGGIVLNLKVVRLDNQPVTFPVALVRGLAAAFSVIVFFLGFLWIAWDKEKQAWHDKIAGTVVVRLPRGMPLVCL